MTFTPTTALYHVSLRSRLLGLFAALAVVPILALSLFDYFRSMEAVRRLIADQTSQIADRAARRLAENLEVVTADLRLLADNAETMRMYAAWSADSTRFEESRVAARGYVAQAWQVMSDRLARVIFEDSSGRVLDRFDGGVVDADLGGAAFESTMPIYTVTVPVLSVGGAPMGRVVAAARMDALVPRALLETSVGHQGYTIVADSTGRSRYDPNQGYSERGTAALSAISVASWSVTDSLSRSLVSYVEGDTQRVATLVAVRGSPLIVVSSGSLDELADSFARVRVVNLALALLVAAVLAIAFVIITRRTTRPLETLTSAAVEVGRGNFSPRLPPADADEIGRLSAAFAAMSGRIDQMVGEVESSRQMAAVGSFSRQIAHEIRNPLTSIKLNLQGLERDARAGVVMPDTPRTLEICLEEIHRLERVVRGVLALGRAPTTDKKVVPLHGIVARAVDVVRPQLAQQKISLSFGEDTAAVDVDADAEQLVAMFLNVLVNAAEAMPDGGSLSVEVERAVTESGLVGRVTIADSGPGIPESARQRVFEPFFTTKVEGSGLGLAVAVRDAEAHRGRITLLNGEARPGGATFVIELPLASEGTP